MQNFVEIDSEMTSQRLGKLDLFQALFQERKCCHGNSKVPILNLLLLNIFLYIFKKSHQNWLNYLSPSLSYGQKASRVVPNTPPGRIGLKLEHCNFKLRGVPGLGGGGEFLTTFHAH